MATGLSTFQFANDQVRALSQAHRVSRGPVAVVVPARVAESGIPAVFKALSALFPTRELEGLRSSGMYALSSPNTLERALAAAGLTARHDDEVESPAVLPDADAATRAFLATGAMALAIRHSGEQAVAEAVRGALGPFTDAGGRVTLPAWYRVVLAR